MVFKKNLSNEYLEHQEVTWWAFSSCTKSLTVLESDLYLGNKGERTLFSIEVINAKIINEHSHFPTEDEILLLSGTYMEVVSKFNPAPDLYIVHLKQKIPSEILLEPPFESNHDLFLQLIQNYYLFRFRCNTLSINFSNNSKRRFQVNIFRIGISFFFLYF